MANKMHVLCVLLLEPIEAIHKINIEFAPKNFFEHSIMKVGCLKKQQYDSYNNNMNVLMFHVTSDICCNILPSSDIVLFGLFIVLSILRVTLAVDLPPPRALFFTTS